MAFERLPGPPERAPTPAQIRELDRLVELIRHTARNMRANIRRAEQHGARRTTQYTIERQLAVCRTAATALVDSPGFNPAQHGQVIELFLRLEQRANDALRQP